ncbi:hypothetical protein [Arenimonas oryziterrae]|uniref:Uncharacterized protein n=1 Tax=Arenimonas oryziterrae DSM 21050 = YC6267 TaxID=1121015 RepID=A0A091BIN1_9GAMM|nr:hypothetical protein [Arenimonas oryziterrae]KFN44200.1 hypothetical protein N789_07220 [Arenimonas oryziterrae DSM 21050 = YC6267]
MSDVLSCLGAVALELSPGHRAGRQALDPDTAGALAACVARDLAKLVPAAAGLDFALLAGLFDPVELLRPRWPLHGELERLIAQAPGAGPRVIAFAAHAGELPVTLRPHPDFAEGPLRLLPFVLRGDPATIAVVGEALEASLLDRGMAAADTALLAQDGFAATIEHARYLTVHDLAAMIAMQYEHVGLAPVWPLIETALLAPDQEQWLDAPPEPLARLVGGEAHLALFDDAAWGQGGFAPAGDLDAARLSRAFDRFQARQRQIAALLEAHGIPVTFDYCSAGQDARALLRA